ncbi:MAG: hypothetical protein DMF67_03460 [Acidobacteria bacterium]|nr:MAG: hypothetical protein DMF66_08725 [Acidobacteriota bacterium]PYS84768.1 MAG: hypothetical protein DMF67_03460 [Acidobacteriota bacterium]
MAELFDRFEINRVPRWPLLSRLLALSVVVHGLFIVTVAYVPTLRSLLYVAGAVSGLKLVSEDYDPTLIGQRATIVQLAPHEKLYYPPDYFGAPEVAETSAFDPTLVQQAAPPPPQVFYRPPRRAYTPRALPTPQPSPSPEVAKANPTPSPAASPTPDEAQRKAEEAEMDRVAKANGIERPPEINTKPFEDIALKGKELIDQGKLDLKNSTLDVTATAERNDDGTLKAETVKIEGLANDENMSLLAQQLITALSQSKVLVVLKGAKDVRIALKLDQQNVAIKVLSELPSEDDANKTANGCALLVALGRKAKQGTNEGELYNSLKFDNDGKQFSMSFEMPKDAAGKMIADMLAKKAAKDAAAQNKS